MKADLKMNCLEKTVWLWLLQLPYFKVFTWMWNKNQKNILTLPHTSCFSSFPSDGISQFQQETVQSLL